MKGKKILITILIIAIIAVAYVILVKKSESTNKTSQTISTESFKIDLPIGFNITPTGEGETFGFRAKDIENDSEIFYYSKFTPYNKSKEAADIFASADSSSSEALKKAYEARANAPILEELTIDEVLNKYTEFTTYYNKYFTKYEYPVIEGAKIEKIEGYESYLKDKMTSEDLVKISFERDSKKYVGIFVASIDGEEKNIIGFADTAEISVRNIFGIIVLEENEEKISEYIDILGTFKFTENAVNKASQIEKKDEKALIYNTSEITNIIKNIKGLYLEKNTK